MQAPYSKLIFALRVCNSLYAVLLSLEGIQLFTTNVTPKIIQGPRTLLSFFKDFDTRPSLYKPEEPPTSTHRLWKTEVCSSYPFLGACYNRESWRRRIQEPFTSSVRSKDCHHYKKGRELGVVACFWKRPWPWEKPQIKLLVFAQLRRLWSPGSHREVMQILKSCQKKTNTLPKITNRNNKAGYGS